MRKEPSVKIDDRSFLTERENVNVAVIAPPPHTSLFSRHFKTRFWLNVGYSDVVLIVLSLGTLIADGIKQILFLIRGSPHPIV